MGIKTAVCRGNKCRPLLQKISIFENTTRAPVEDLTSVQYKSIYFHIGDVHNIIHHMLLSTCEAILVKQGHWDVVKSSQQWTAQLYHPPPSSLSNKKKMFISMIFNFFLRSKSYSSFNEPFGYFIRYSTIGSIPLKRPIDSYFVRRNHVGLILHRSTISRSTEV